MLNAQISPVPVQVSGASVYEGTVSVAANTSNAVLRNGVVSNNRIAIVSTRVKASIGSNGVSTAITSISSNTATLAAHGLVTGQPILLGGTTAPTGLTLGVIYYAIVLNSSTFNFATTPANAASATAITLSSAGTAVTFTPVKQTGYFETKATVRVINGVASVLNAATSIVSHKDTALAAVASTVVANNTANYIGFSVVGTSDPNLITTFKYFVDVTDENL